MNYSCKKITAVTGHYGCGKTNLSLNLALYLAKLGRVSIIDMDIVNPYFRTADYTDRLKSIGISVISPRYAGTNLDIPITDFDVESIAENSDYTIIDVGGDDSGAVVLGKYREYFNQKKDDFEMLYVFNKYRNCSVSETVEIMRDIEKASRISCTALVNNSNLGSETTTEIVANSAELASELCTASGLPLAFSCAPEIVKLPWEEERIDYDNR